jgi:glycosyltransferase involved in cell wall biosynthesis
MKVLFVNRMMGVSWGGGENFDYHLARGFQKRGHEVVFLTGQWGNRPNNIPQEIETICIESPYLRRYMYRLAGKLPTVPGLIAETDLALFLRAARSQIEKTVKARSIDVGQVLALPHLASWIRSLCPVAMRFPGPPAWFQSPLLRRLGRDRRSRLFAHGDAVRYFRERVHLDVENIPPGIDTELFRPADQAARASQRARLGLRPNDFALVSVARLIHGKGHPELLQTMAACRDRVASRLLLVGDGPMRTQFERQARELGLGSCVQFLGHMDKQGVAATLQASDAFCLFSAYENYSNAALEAMAVGLPVLATRVGGFPSQVQEGVNGHLVDGEDTGAAAACIAGLAGDPQRMTRMSLAAQSFAARFSWDATAGRVEELYAGLLGQ